MIKAVIIDDELKGIELLSDMLNIYCPDLKTLAVADSVKSGYDTIVLNKPDLVFLDIHMQDGTGFDLVKKFAKVDFKIIFVTAYEEFAIKAFQFSALDYILKPVSPESLINAVKRATEIIGENNSNTNITTLLDNIKSPSKEDRRIVLKTAERIYVINVKEIVRCESDGGYTSVYLKDGKKVLVSRLLKEFDEMLTEYDFFRSQQSHLVNLEYLDYYDKSNGMIVLKDKSTIPVASRKKEELLRLIDNI